MRRLLVLTVGLALLAPASAQVSTGSVSSTAPPLADAGCVSGSASFTGQGYCLDGDGPQDVISAQGSPQAAVSQGLLTSEQVQFGELQLNGWQVPTRCNGNGTSGKREQLVYVHVEGEPDIAAQALPFITQRLIPGANGVFEHTTGGKRAVRWVTRKTATGCVPTIDKVDVPMSANFSAEPFYTIGADVLKALGGINDNRSYLILVDHADAYDCGLGEVRPDETPGTANINNTGGAVAMVWANCWTGLVAAHELTHTLGAVQQGAPHHTDRGHCWDGLDAMCYADGSPQKQRLVCTAPDSFRKLDCNGDDYFALHPKPGSYLAEHWNSADSPFLIDAKPAVLPTRPGQPTVVTVTTADAGHVLVSWQPGVTARGALTSWTVLVGAQTGDFLLDDTGRYPLNVAARTITLGPKARSVVVAVKPDLFQGFAVYASNVSGDGVTSAIVEGGAGSPPSAIAATYTVDPFGFPEVDWTGGTSDPGVVTCTAVTVNGVRADGYTGTLADTTDPDAECDSVGSPVYLPVPLATTDVLQVLARNEFGTTTVTVPHP